MQFEPDWRDLCSAEQISSMTGKTFTGPGFYLSKNDTMLVVPTNGDEAVNPNAIWLADQSKDMIYVVRVWNCRFGDTIFGSLAGAPVRSDCRMESAPVSTMEQAATYE